MQWWETKKSSPCTWVMLLCSPVTVFVDRQIFKCKFTGFPGRKQVLWSRCCVSVQELHPVDRGKAQHPPRGPAGPQSLKAGGRWTSHWPLHAQPPTTETTHHLQPVKGNCSCVRSWKANQAHVFVAPFQNKTLDTWVTFLIFLFWY